MGRYRIKSFVGIWYSPRFGRFTPPILERFKPQMPRDKLHKELKKADLKPHEQAKPTWISKEEFEKNFGEVEYAEVSTEYSSPTLDDWGGWDITIWTDKNVVRLQEYEGWEYFLSLPRNPPKKPLEEVKDVVYVAM